MRHDSTDTTCDCDRCEREATLAAEYEMFLREYAARAPSPAPLPLSLALSPAIIAELDADPTV